MEKSATFFISSSLVMIRRIIIVFCCCFWLSNSFLFFPVGKYQRTDKNSYGRYVQRIYQTTHEEVSNFRVSQPQITSTTNNHHATASKSTSPITEYQIEHDNISSIESSPSSSSCLPGQNEKNKKQKTFLRDLSTIDEWIAKEGEVGIDLFGITKNVKSFFTWRESEIKHGRLAMLAAFGWPVSELYHYKISQTIGVQNFLATGERAPSVLNGGLDNLYVLFGFGVFLAIGSVLETQLMNRRKEQPESLQNFYDMWREDGWDAPGNYGFDPLQFSKLFCPTPRSKVYMQNIEIFNGRLAMLATVGYAIQEFVTGLPVVTETPQFFTFK